MHGRYVRGFADAQMSGLLYFWMSGRTDTQMLGLLYTYYLDCRMRGCPNAACCDCCMHGFWMPEFPGGSIVISLATVMLGWLDVGMSACQGSWMSRCWMPGLLHAWMPDTGMPGYLDGCITGWRDSKIRGWQDCQTHDA